MSGQCSGCSGCSFEVILCREEVSILLELAKYAFLPIIQIVEHEAIQYLPTPEYRQAAPENFSEIILSLEQKHLVTIDPNIPLSNADYGSIAEDKKARFGSLALTAQGQEALDWISPLDFSL
jgi:hypothetical protein